MAAAEVPTGASFVCRTPTEAAAALDAFGAPYVVKDDGLAAGKGVVVTSDRDAALAHAAGCEQVVIEEYLDGPEVSLFAITDGCTVYPLQPAQDFKRIFDGDQGPNTGGMGAYTPLPWAPADLVDEVHRDVLQPTVDEMARRGTPVRGPALRRPRADLAWHSRHRVQRPLRRPRDPSPDGLAGLAAGSAAVRRGHRHPRRRAAPAVEAGAAVAVVMASKGYPESSSSGDVIDGLAGGRKACRRPRHPRRHGVVRRRHRHRRRPGAGRDRGRR